MSVTCSGQHTQESLSHPPSGPHLGFSRPDPEFQKHQPQLIPGPQTTILCSSCMQNHLCPAGPAGPAGIQLYLPHLTVPHLLTQPADSHTLSSFTLPPQPTNPPLFTGSTSTRPSQTRCPISLNGFKFCARSHYWNNEMNAEPIKWTNWVHSSKPQPHQHFKRILPPFPLHGTSCLPTHFSSFTFHYFLSLTPS